jgi:hypothetical protein
MLAWLTQRSPPSSAEANRYLASRTARICASATARMPAR